MQDAVLAVVLLVCLITDLKEHKIYNIIIFPAFLFGLAYNILAGGWSGLLQSGLGILVGLAILFIPFALGGMGGGDVKLLAVVGAVKGPLFVFYTALGMGLVGGIMAMVIMSYKVGLFRNPAKFFQSMWLMLLTRFKVIDFQYSSHKKILLPYGLAIPVGAAGAFWWMR